MQVAGIRRVGARVEMIEVGEPRPLAGDEVLLEVRAAGVGNWDEFVRTGGWDVGARPPMALGVEAAGMVLAVGQAVGDWAPGDAVMTHPVPLRDQGTWAPRLIAPAGLLARKPPSASWEAAAAFPVPALTAEQVLGDALNIRAGEQLLVHGAGGVTGGLLVALGCAARRPGHRDGRPGKPAAGKRARGAPRHRLPRPRLARTGPRDHRDATEWPPRPTRHPAAPPARSGRSPTAGGWRPSPPDPPSQQRGITVSSIYVRADGSQLRKLAQQLEDGQLEIPIAASYRLADAAQALAQATGGHAGGAIVLTP